THWKRSLDRKAGAATARSRGVRVVHTERGADQVVDEIDLRPRKERRRGRIDQHDGRIALDHQIVLGLGVIDVEFVLEAWAAAAFDGDAQHGATSFALEDFANAAGGPLADG